MEHTETILIQTGSSSLQSFLPPAKEFLLAGHTVSASEFEQRPLEGRTPTNINEQAGLEGATLNDCQKTQSTSIVITLGSKQGQVTHPADARRASLHGIFHNKRAALQKHCNVDESGFSPKENTAGNLNKGTSVLSSPLSQGGPDRWRRVEEAHIPHSGFRTPLDQRSSSLVLPDHRVRRFFHVSRSKKVSYTANPPHLVSLVRVGLLCS